MPLTRKNKKLNRKNRTASRKNRKASRKGNRKNRTASRNNRKNRTASRKNRKSCRKNKKQAGGNPMAQSLDQGKQFMDFHKNQHGGAYLTGAPLSQIDGSMLEPGLRDFARVGGLDASVTEASTQRDPDQMPSQNGGRRNRKNKKSKKNRKASKKSKKNRKSRQAGGALTGAPFNQPTMLLTSAEAAKAGTADFSNPLLKY